MTDPGFIHLRVHSAYSLAEGAIRVKDLVKLCVKNQMPAVAITDTGNLFGALEFSMAAADAGIQPIFGCQIALTVDDPNRRPGQAALSDQLVLLAQNEGGYRNLLKIVSHSFMESDGDPQIDLDTLAPWTDGLIALSGGPAGPIGRQILAGQAGPAEAMTRRLKELFPGRFYMEIQRHTGGVIEESEQATESAFLDLAYAHDIPLVATNDCFFASASMYEAHDALLCIAAGRYVSEQDRRRLTPDHYFRPAAEMRALFEDLPEAADNTVVIARRCAALVKKVNPILPRFTEDGAEADELRRQAEAGLAARLANGVFAAPREDYEKRLAYELDIIVQMGFPGYFLIVSDFIKWAKNEGIPVGPGRGSGAGSVVAWSLLITDLDPIRFGLLFERFLNPERVSMPDFDIDFCQDRRDEVIKYVQARYGTDRVAQIITFGKLQARAVLRDVGRVLQMPYGQVDRICKLVPNNPANPVTLAEALEQVPELEQQRKSDPTVERLVGVALQLEGLYRHASTHAAGVVIGDRPLQELVPLYRDPRSTMPVTQFNMKTVELAGLVKFDFLGLKTLTVIQEAVRLIREGGGAVDIDHLPLDDGPTYAMLSKGDTTSVFQLESSGMKDTLRRLKPTAFTDIIALVALYRPGPMDNIPRYIAVKNGEEEPDYLHPSLKGILEETFGIMIYQEQVMQIAQVLAGYSLGAADLLRRAMGKKIKEEMAAQRANFIKGAAEKGVPEDQSGMIFDQVDKFAGYGFNKSHAAAYALVAYHTAWLKANYPVEFMAASMTLDMGNTDKLNIYRQELQRMGIALLPPEINTSRDIFTVENGGIRYALPAVKGVGAAAMKLLVADRDENGRFRDVMDLARRLDNKVLNKRQLESLVAAGAFDSLNPNRAQLFAGVELLVREAAAAGEQRETGQAALFGAIEDKSASTRLLPNVPPWEPLEKLKHEFDAVGFYLSAHPLDSYGPRLARVGAVRAADLKARASMGGSSRFKVAGIVISKQERTAKSGNRFAFAQLSDMSGVFEVTLFSELLAVSREFLEPGSLLLVTLDAQVTGEDMRLTAQALEPLEKALERVGENLQIVVTDVGALSALKGFLDTAGTGKGRLQLSVPSDLGDIEIDLPGFFALNRIPRGELRRLPGIAEVIES
jgi:DNA polymerase III subunit alpha